jgi:hypothetical protein
MIIFSKYLNIVKVLRIYLYQNYFKNIIFIHQVNFRTILNIFK